MPDLSILNTLIAMVIVILVLSLIVQSLQTLVKKLFKLKSRTILNSLQDLFETITRDPAGAAAPPARAPQQLVKNVTDRLGEMGRETLFGRPMLDSLAKGDLLKVLTRVEAENLLPGAVSKFQGVLGATAGLKTLLAEVARGPLGGDASARFAALQASVMPLVNDIEALATGDKINPNVLLGDLYNLRQIKAAEVLDILGQIQQKVGEDLEAAGAADAAARKALADAQQSNDEARLGPARARAAEAEGRLRAARGVADGLKRVAEQITALGQAFDAAFAPLRERLGQAEVWYDTVMQGFEERYTRHMRTVAIVISVFVVVLLNANFFTIYQTMSNPQTAAAVSEQGEGILKRSRQAAPAADGPETAGDVRDQARAAGGWVDTYKSFGIAPLTRQQVGNFFKGEYKARDLSGTFAGWLIMVMLLSAGAPFWQDTLESLFGLKNLLRQKSDTKNIEGGKGGQPNP
jgi:hypothetical protein